jgi:hypothetical protein
MNKPAQSPVLATVCLATLSLGSAAAMETDLQLGPDYLRIGADLANKHYDQGVIRNENVTAIGRLDARKWDIGVHAEWFLAANSDDSQPQDVSAGETTQINLGVDYLFEMQDVFQIIPHYNFTAYPNWTDAPYKDDQHWIGVDAWYLLPWQGFEVGFNVDYNAFYNGRVDAYHGYGGLDDHAFRTAIAARQIFNDAPLDITFYEVLNMGNGAYKNFLIGSDGDDSGFTTLDLGLRYVAPFHLDEFWVVSRLEAHFWLENDDREALRAAGRNTTEVIFTVGFEWKP